MLADRLRRAGIKAEVLLAATLGASMVAQFGLVAQWPLPPFVAWMVIGAAGAATVLSFAILGERYPKEMSGRANAALNLLHVGGAFVLQSAIGFIIALWPPTDGAYPAEAHRAAMASMLVLQLVALAWFVLPHRYVGSAKLRSAHGPVYMSLRWQMQGAVRYATVGSRIQYVHRLHRQRAHWRFAAAASAAVCVGLMAAVVTVASAPASAIQALEVVPITVEAIDDLEGSQPLRALRAMPPALMRPIAASIPLPTTIEALR
jgi:MFS family permease